MPLNPDRVKARRLELGLTQLQVAEAIGVAQPNYARMEGHRIPTALNPKLDLALSLAKALKTTVEKLAAR